MIKTVMSNSLCCNSLILPIKIKEELNKICFASAFKCVDEFTADCYTVRTFSNIFYFICKHNKVSNVSWLAHVEINVAYLDMKQTDYDSYVA